MSNLAFGIVYLAVAVGLLYGQEVKTRSIRADFVFLQKDTPLQVVGVTMSLQELYQSVVVVNVSNRTILRAQLGWTISNPRDPNRDRVVVGFGPPFDLNLPPLEVAKIGSQGATFSIVTEMLQKLDHARGKLMIGAVNVKFEDGGEWTYPLSTRREFDQSNDPALVERISPKVREFRRSQGHYGKNADPRERRKTGLFAAILGAFTVPTVHAQNPWWFVCDPAPRHCINSGETGTCTTYFCDVEICNFALCCAINTMTGEKICE